MGWRFFNKRGQEPGISPEDVVNTIAMHKAYHKDKLATIQMGPATEYLLRCGIADKLDRRPHDLPSFNGATYDGIIIVVVRQLPVGQLVLYDEKGIPLHIYN